MSQRSQGLLSVGYWRGSDLTTNENPKLIELTNHSQEEDLWRAFRDSPPIISLSLEARKKKTHNLYTTLYYSEKKMQNVLNVLKTYSYIYILLSFWFIGVFFKIVRLIRLIDIIRILNLLKWISKKMLKKLLVMLKFVFFCGG